MGTLLDKPITEKETHSDAANGYRYGVSAMQGWRVEMEDAHIAIGSIEGLEDHGFFAVFDGHGGRAFVSDYDASCVHVLRLTGA